MPFATFIYLHRLSINDDYRVLFEFIDKHKVLLIDFGTHEDVY